MKILITISLVGLLAILPVCNKSTSSEDITILVDSFERAGSPTTTGWQITPELTDFAGDTPTDNNVYSLKLMPGNTIEGTAIKEINADHGDGVYRLSVWGKMSPDQPSHTGYIRFGVLRNQILIQSAQFELTDTVWTEYAVTDTLDFEPDDEFHIFLSCGYSIEPAEWYSLFDLATITKLAE